jgi:hypothetical protein
MTLGRGKRLFGDGTPARAFRIVDPKVTPSGTMIATYEPGGAILTEGSFPKPSMSAREQERQRKMQRGRW